jgi:hypothetical protein
VSTSVVSRRQHKHEPETWRAGTRWPGRPRSKPLYLADECWTGQRVFTLFKQSPSLKGNQAIALQRIWHLRHNLVLSWEDSQSPSIADSRWLLLAVVLEWHQRLENRTKSAPLQRFSCAYHSYSFSVLDQVHANNSCNLTASIDMTLSTQRNPLYQRLAD